MVLGEFGVSRDLGVMDRANRTRCDGGARRPPTQGLPSQQCSEEFGVKGFKQNVLRKPNTGYLLLVFSNGAKKRSAP